jgi:hypothetical protein
MRVGWFALLLTIGTFGACGVGSEFPPTQPDDDVPSDSGSEADVPTFGPVIAPSDDPATCEQAAQWQSYVGCDFWPTVTANIVWSIFDFAVVVANAGVAPAAVTITGPGGTSQSVTVAPNELAKLYLPWVPALKGTDTDSCGTSVPLSASVLATGAAYHLVSSVPVTVYQFNALEYAPQGGPAGKDWSSCPGDQICSDMNSPFYGQKVGCYSFTNDSSLLLPSTALTGNYRVTSYPGQTATGSDAGTTAIMGSYVAITGITDGTHVKVYVGPFGDVVAGTGVAATAANQELDLTLGSGDVAELVSDLGDQYDLSGSLITADQPIQVISGAPCEYVPEDKPACDHLEQSVFPAETLGQQYFVSMPSGPTATSVGHVVRFYGNVDGTTLTYAPAMPSGCPATLNAGQVVDCGVVLSNFEVTGTNNFAVGTFMQGGSVVDPNGGLGDPSESMVASVEQYRTKYVFLAPDDYDINIIDVIAPAGAELVLDGALVHWGSVSPIADGYDVWRVGLATGSTGAHTLESSTPVGMQVLGYGLYTSYQYPAGLNLKRIAPPPGPTQ